MFAGCADPHSDIAVFRCSSYYSPLGRCGKALTIAISPESPQIAAGTRRIPKLLATGSVTAAKDIFTTDRDFAGFRALSQVFRCRLWFLGCPRLLDEQILFRQNAGVLHHANSWTGFLDAARILANAATGSSCTTRVLGRGPLIWRTRRREVFAPREFPGGPLSGQRDGKSFPFWLLNSPANSRDSAFPGRRFGTGLVEKRPYGRRIPINRFALVPQSLL